MIHPFDTRYGGIAREDAPERPGFDYRPLLLVAVVLAICGGVLAYVQRALSQADARLSGIERELARTSPTAASETTAAARTASPGIPQTRYLGRFDRIRTDDGVMVVYFYPGQVLTGKTAVSVAASNGDAVRDGLYVLGHRGRTDHLYAATGTPVHLRVSGESTEVSLKDVAERLALDHDEFSRRYMWFTVAEGFIVDVQEADIPPLTENNTSEWGSQ